MKNDSRGEALCERVSPLELSLSKLIGMGLAYAHHTYFGRELFRAIGDVSAEMGSPSNS